MSRFFVNLLFLFFLITNQSIAQENIMILKLKDGDVKIELFPDVAPNHVKRIKELAKNGKYDNVVFHRVIDGFMAQTGDVKFGNSSSGDFNLSRAGMGGSDLPDLKQEFSNLPHDRGTLSMARSSDPNSANSQFFICFKPAPFLDNQYTVFGKVIEGMELVDKIKKGDESNNGSVSDPDKIISFKSL
jgi:cyclophilin family peptidyl-prolyl cis-trans isomerase